MMSVRHSIRPHLSGIGMKRMYIDSRSGNVYNGYPARKSMMREQKNHQLSREKRSQTKKVAAKVEKVAKKEDEKEESGSGARSGHMWSQKPSKRIGAHK